MEGDVLACDIASTMAHDPFGVQTTAYRKRVLDPAELVNDELERNRNRFPIIGTHLADPLTLQDG